MEYKIKFKKNNTKNKSTKSIYILKLEIVKKIHAKYLEFYVYLPLLF